MAVTSREILVITNFNAFMKTAATQQIWQKMIQNVNLLKNKI